MCIECVSSVYRVSIGCVKLVPLSPVPPSKGLGGGRGGGIPLGGAGCRSPVGTMYNWVHQSGF